MYLSRLLTTLQVCADISIDPQWCRTKFRSKKIYHWQILHHWIGLGDIFRKQLTKKSGTGGFWRKTLKWNLCGPAHHPTGRNWPAGQKTPWKGPSGPETLLTCIIHHYMSYWATLGSFRHPWGLKNGPKHHPKGPNWSCMTQIDPARSKLAVVALK